MQDQHTIILRDQAGNYHFKSGISGNPTGPAPEAPAQEAAPELDRKKSRKMKGKAKDDAPEVEQEVEFERAFFLPPFWEIVRCSSSALLILVLRVP